MGLTNLLSGEVNRGASVFSITYTAADLYNHIARCLHKESNTCSLLA